jgi:ribose/xylose/arabinose/galactoside ABC-type transport system permease subunit
MMAPLPTTPPAVASAPLVKRKKPFALAWPLAVLAILLVFNLFANRGFFQVSYREGRLFGSLIDVLNRGSPVMLLSLGMTLVIATGGIDLSVGAIMAIAGAVAGVLLAPPTSPLLVTLHGMFGSAPGVIFAGLLFALAAGMWNGMLASFLDIQPIVATLILMVSGRGIAQLITNGQIPTFTYPSFQFLGSGSFLALPFPFVLVLLAASITILLARGTALGLFIESIGNNAPAANFAGINAKSVKFMTYAFAGVCAGLAGLVQTADIQAADVNNIGLYMELDAIVAVAIGGTSLTGGRFSIIGSLLGAFIMQALTTTILTLGIRPEYNLVIKAFVLIGICLLQADRFRAMFSHLFRRPA